MALYQPNPVITQLGPDFYDPVSAADFPKTILRYRNIRAAAQVGLNDLTDETWRAHFGRFTPLADNLTQPLALRYHGHQFKHYNPDIGDGRGFLFAQLKDDKDRLLDLGTKGTGQTPYSRRGDGRLTLLGGVREVLATSYLEYLGVNTSHSFSLIETGEALTRQDEPSPTRSAVLVRLSYSHIRFGTFQRLAFFEDKANLQKLADYCRHYYYPDTENTVDFFKAVIAASADTVASWMAAGFVHGVMNTDNMNITGESFDYGPYRFLPTLKSDFTAAYFDYQKLYAFSRQPEIMAWNLAQLALSLTLIADDADLIKALKTYADIYRARLVFHVFRRLSITPSATSRDIDFVLSTFRWLEKSQCPWPQFWHDWQGGAAQKPFAEKSPAGTFYRGSDFETWLKILADFDKSADFTPPESQTPPSLLYDEIGALWQPINDKDDWQAFTQKVSAFAL